MRIAAVRRRPAVWAGLVAAALAAVAGAQPAGTALAARDAVKAFKSARAKDESAAGLADAIRKLGEVHDPEVARAVRDFLYHESPDVRIAAAGALGRQTARDAASPLQSALVKNAGQPEVLKALLSALGSLHASEAVDTVVKYVPGDDDGVAKAAIATLGELDSPRAVDHLLRLLESAGKPPVGNGPEAEKQKRLPPLQEPLKKALETITGQKLATAAEWRAWWTRNRGMFNPPGPDGLCPPIPGASYGGSGTAGPTTDRPAAVHPDINFKMRGWVPTLAKDTRLEIIDINGPTDDKAPRINTLFVDERKPAFTSLWDIGAFDGGVAKGICPNGPHLYGMRTLPGEILQCPWSGYAISPRVLYADNDSIVLKYTSEDNIVRGYTIHVFGVAVEPSLLGMYQKMDAGGRRSLPCVAYKAPFGRARGREILVSIRDTGSCMDVRCRKDWYPKGF